MSEAKEIIVNLNAEEVGMIYDAIGAVSWPGRIIEKVVPLKIKVLSALKEVRPDLFDKDGNLKQFEQK